MSLALLTLERLSKDWHENSDAAKMVREVAKEFRALEASQVSSGGEGELRAALELLECSARQCLFHCKHCDWVGNEAAALWRDGVPEYPSDGSYHCPNCPGGDLSPIGPEVQEIEPHQLAALTLAKVAAPSQVPDSGKIREAVKKALALRHIRHRGSLTMSGMSCRVERPDDCPRCILEAALAPQADAGKEKL